MKKIFVLLIAVVFISGLSLVALAETGSSIIDLLPETSSNNQPSVSTPENENDTECMPNLRRKLNFGRKNGMRPPCLLSPEDMEAFKESIEDEDLTPEEIRSKLIEYKTSVIDQKVSDGELTQEEADAIKEKISQMQENCPAPMNGQRGFDCIFSPEDMEAFKESIEAEGLTPEEIRAKLIEYKTSIIDQKVIDGELTQEEADALKEKISTFNKRMRSKIKDKMDLNKGNGSGGRKGNGSRGRRGAF